MKSDLNAKTSKNVPISTRFDFYAKKIKFKNQRAKFVEEMSNFIKEDELTQEEALEGLQILTRAFLYDKSTPYKKNHYDAEHAQRLTEALYWFPGPARNEGIETITVKYLKNAEMLINEVDVTFPPEKKLDKLYSFAECFHEMSSCYLSLPPRGLPFHGQYLRISDKAFHHGRSVLILPDDPKDAVALLHDERPRILFAEYDRENSAETTAKQLYGTDGGYAEHYKAFLNCKDRYPNQKHLLQIV